MCPQKQDMIVHFIIGPLRESFILYDISLNFFFFSFSNLMKISKKFYILEIVSSFTFFLEHSKREKFIN